MTTADRVSHDEDGTEAAAPTANSDASTSPSPHHSRAWPATTDVVSSGDPAIDAVLARLDSIDPQASPAQLLPILTEVHDAMAERLRAAEG